MIVKNYIKISLLIVSVLVIATNARALPDYLKIFAADSFSRPELRTKCSVCHLNPAGGGERNSFGKAFAAAGHKITPALRQQFPDRFLPISPGQDIPTAIAFPKGSQTEAVVEMNGRKYLINTREQTVTLLVAEPAQAAGKEPQARQTRKSEHPDADIYQPVDVRVINLPTAIAIPKGSLWVDFTHRFPFNDVTEPAELFGLDGFAAPSFGFTYGITDRLHAGAFRSPSLIGRPIEVFLGLSMLEERKGHPFSLMGRVALEGRDNFQRNFAASLELTLARSVTRHAQIYIVPTVTFGDRPLAIAPNQNFEGRTAVALGVGASVNIRPSVALMAEANLRLNEESRYTGKGPQFGLGIHRPVVGFGIQKASGSRRHSFTLTFSNGLGATFAQRSMTRGLVFSNDSMSGMTIGFNITRRLF